MSQPQKITPVFLSEKDITPFMLPAKHASVLIKSFKQGSITSRHDETLIRIAYTLAVFQENCLAVLPRGAGYRAHSDLTLRRYVDIVIRPSSVKPTFSARASIVSNCKKKIISIRFSSTSGMPMKIKIYPMLGIHGPDYRKETTYASETPSIILSESVFFKDGGEKARAILNRMQEKWTLKSSPK